LCAFIRPVLEYASPVWHFSLPQFLAEQIESIQKRTLRAKPSRILLGTARRSERDSAELVYILCGADNPKTWIIMRNFKFVTGFITGFDPNRKLLIKSSSGK
jgi:hypothetical protein